MSIDVFKEKYVNKSRKRQDLFNKFLNEFSIIKRHCYAYQITFLGSYITDKAKPGDIDVYLRAFVTEAEANFLPKHRLFHSPILPFHDYEMYVDIFPITAIVSDTPTILSIEELLKAFNTTNGYNTQNAVQVMGFQKHK